MALESLLKVTEDGVDEGTGSGNTALNEGLPPSGLPHPSSMITWEGTKERPTFQPASE